MLQKIFISISALFLTHTLWAQSTARLTVSATSLNKNGVDIKMSQATENEKACIEAQAVELESVGIVRTIHFSPKMRIYLFSEMTSNDPIRVQEASDNEVELVDDYSDKNHGGSSLTVTLSVDGICKITSAKKVNEIFQNYYY